MHLNWGQYNTQYGVNWLNTGSIDSILGSIRHSIWYYSRMLCEPRLEIGYDLKPFSGEWLQAVKTISLQFFCIEENNMISLIASYTGPIWGWQDPVGPNVGPMNFAIGVHWCIFVFTKCIYSYPGLFYWNPLDYIISISHNMLNIRFWNIENNSVDPKGLFSSAKY